MSGPVHAARELGCSQQQHGSVCVSVCACWERGKTRDWQECLGDHFTASFPYYLSLSLSFSPSFCQQNDGEFRSILLLQPMFADVWPAELISPSHPSRGCRRDVPRECCDLDLELQINSGPLGLPADIQSSKSFSTPCKVCTYELLSVVSIGTFSQNKNSYILWSVFFFLTDCNRSSWVPFTQMRSIFEFRQNPYLMEVSWRFSELYYYSSIYSYKDWPPFWRFSVWSVWTVTFMTVLDPMKHYRMLETDRVHAIRGMLKNQFNTISSIPQWSTKMFGVWCFALANGANK